MGRDHTWAQVFFQGEENVLELKSGDGICYVYIYWES